jgi:hypothetical protein
LVEHAFERHEVPAAFCRGLEVEPLSVDQRVVVAGERCQVAPVARNLDQRPLLVVVLEADRAAAALVVGDIGTPLSRQIHDGEDRRGLPDVCAVRAGMVDPWHPSLPPSAN